MTMADFPNNFARNMNETDHIFNFEAISTFTYYLYNEQMLNIMLYLQSYVIILKTYYTNQRNYYI